MKKINILSLLALAASLLFLNPSPACAANYTVTMNSTAFSPVTLTIGVGDRVTWTNASAGLGSTHTSTRGDPLCSTNGFAGTFWNSGDMLSHATYSFTFTNFAAGTYTYLCIQHCSFFGMKGTIILTNFATVPPTVSLTNPAPNTAFPAPANITLVADANAPGGSVTNVQFFSSGALLANVNTQPYKFIFSNVAAGNYSFTAQAWDNFGAAATSSVVNVFVLTNAILSAPVLLPNGQFHLTVSGIAGQTYATEASSNLMNWQAITTNVAPANLFNVTNATSTNILLRFYRTRQDF